MVLQKRLDYGFNGYQVPPTPRAARSARRRRSFKNKVDDNQMCAFDLLATVAGKLLLEGENTRSSTEMFTGEDQWAVVKDSIKKENLDEDNPEKPKLSDEESCARNFFLSELVSQEPLAKHCVMELSHSQIDASSGFASVVTSSDGSEKHGSAAKMVNGESKIEHGNSATKVDAGSSRYSLSFGIKLDGASMKCVKLESPMTGKETIGSRVDMSCSEDPVVRDRKPPLLASSGNSVKLPVKPSFLDGTPQKAFCRNHSPCGFFPGCRDSVKLVSRDDDENSSGCTQPSTLNKACRPPPWNGDRRRRRLLASKYWKETPNLKDEECFSTGTEKNSANIRINCYKRQRSLRDYPFKKRKLYDCSFLANSDGVVSSDGTSSSHWKCSSGDASGSGATMRGATRASSEAGQETSFQRRDTHVKLKIKSFRVPELFIEIPENATVGSLKRTVMEKVNAILSGGLRVCVLQHGKKIRDDNKTLLQTGILDDNKMDALGFILEPNSSQAPPSLHPEDHSFVLPCDTPQPLTKCSHSPSVVQLWKSDVSLDLPIANCGNLIESDHDSAPSPPDISIDKNLTDSRAVVAVPEMNVDALDVVPMRKSKRLDVGQRRIRRPFSVSEVEALVQAVEELGTGRWRDVKLRAFDKAKHRTYVDLKDKWKTLVHTARISPQQRRGEPVPQQLLDRVLAAHAFWSQHQAKQQLKQHSEACLLL